MAKKHNKKTPPLSPKEKRPPPSPAESIDRGPSKPPEDKSLILRDLTSNRNLPPSPAPRSAGPAPASNTSPAVGRHSHSAPPSLIQMNKQESINSFPTANSTFERISNLSTFTLRFSRSNLQHYLNSGVHAMSAYEIFFRN